MWWQWVVFKVLYVVGMKCMNHLTELGWYTVVDSQTRWGVNRSCIFPSFACRPEKTHIYTKLHIGWAFFWTSLIHNLTSTFFRRQSHKHLSKNDIGWPTNTGQWEADWKPIRLSPWDWLQAGLQESWLILSIWERRSDLFKFFLNTSFNFNITLEILFYSLREELESQICIPLDPPPQSSTPPPSSRDPRRRGLGSRRGAAYASPRNPA
jgi:hypothetical protein